MKLSVAGDRTLLKALIEKLEKNGFKLDPKNLNETVDQISELFYPNIWIFDETYKISCFRGFNKDQHYKLPEDWDYLASLKPEQDVELKVGMYIKDTIEDDLYMLISSFDGDDVRYANGGFDPIYSVKECIKSGRYTIPTTEEITEYLKDQAIRKYSGKKVKCLDDWGIGVFNYSSLFYDEKFDQLWMKPNGLEYFLKIYDYGKWTKTVNDTIAGYEIGNPTLKTIKIGCFPIWRSTIDDIQDALDRHINIQIYVDGKDVTNELKNLDI